MEKENMKNNSSNNKVVVALLAVLIVVVLCIGGYFIVKSNSSNDDNNKNDSSQTSDDKSGSDSGQSQGGDASSGDASSSDTPAPAPAQTDLDAMITYAEVRSNDYYIEAQVNEQVNGTCDISIVPIDGSQGHHDTDDLEIKNTGSVCDEEFSLKGMNPGEHKITVIIKATDGRTKTLEKVVNV